MFFHVFILVLIFIHIHWWAIKNIRNIIKPELLKKLWMKKVREGENKP